MKGKAGEVKHILTHKPRLQLLASLTEKWKVSEKAANGKMQIAAPHQSVQ